MKYYFSEETNVVRIYKNDSEYYSKYGVFKV